MPLPFDATLKYLAKLSPAGLLATFDVPLVQPISLLNVDLSTVTTSADLVFGLGEPLTEIVHLDFQSSASASKHADIVVYNALLYRQYLVPVHSIIVLLRPQALHRNLHGAVAYAPRPGRGKMDYQYEVVRLWERPADELLAGDVGAAPLAVLGQLPAGVDLEASIAGLVRQLIERLEREAAPDQLRRLLTASYVLTGLRVPRDVAQNLFRGVQAMHDSDTYLAIMDEGAVKELKKMILKLGARIMGQPDESVKTTLEGVDDIERLESLLERLDDVSSWQDLLTSP